MAVLELKLLGELAVTQDGEPLPAVKSQKGLALLSYLAVSGKEAKRPFLPPSSGRTCRKAKP
jgi:DNA-binding SARP family transcriptional activator